MHDGAWHSHSYIASIIYLFVSQWVKSDTKKFIPITNCLKNRTNKSLRQYRAIRQQVDILISKNQAMQILYLKHCAYNETT